MSAVPQSFTTTSLDRRMRMLRTAMGPQIAAALEDPDVVEIMLNPDHTLWSIACRRVARRLARSCPKQTANASSVLSPPTSAPKCIAASRS